MSKPIKCNNWIADYVVVDLETTGLSSNTDEMIEIGAVRYRKHKPVAEFQFLVKPSTSIPSNIAGITGVSDADVSEADSISTMMPGISKFIGDDVVVGHNVLFDLRFLYKSAQKNNIQMDVRYVDTLELSRKLLPDIESHSLSQTCKALNVINRRSHRALTDCYATGECYRKFVGMKY